MPTLRLKIDELKGATDAAHLEKALESVPRVKSVEIDPSAKQAVVEHDGATEQELKTAAEALGYQVAVR